MTKALWSPFDLEHARPLRVWPIYAPDLLIDPGAPDGPRGVPRARRRRHNGMVDVQRPSEEATCSLANFAPPWMWSWVPCVPFSEMTDTGLFLGDYGNLPERPWPHQKRPRKLRPSPLVTRAGPVPGLR